MAMLSTNMAFADVKLDGVSFDPSVIAVGDEVTIIVNFHEENKAGNLENAVSNDGSVSLKATLVPKNTLAKDYVTMVSADGFNIGHLFEGDAWRQNYKVKVNNNAPVGEYEFDVVFQYYKNNAPYRLAKKESFIMDVTKEGIILNVANVNTNPSQVRSGDDYVQVSTFVENSGEKDAKSIELNLVLPEGFEGSYSNNNRVWLGYLGASESKSVDFYLDVDENLQSGVYNLTLNLDYSDLDNNKNSKTVTIPFLVKPKPKIDIVSSYGEGLAGSDGELRVVVKNNGEDRAESVDVRIVKESLQPFEIEVRNSYVGSLEPGEEAVAIFKIDINKEANINNYDFKMLIRAKGNGENGDNNIYVFNRNADFEVTGKAENKLFTYGLYALIAIVLIYVLRVPFKKTMRKRGKN